MGYRQLQKLKDAALNRLVTSKSPPMQQMSLDFESKSPINADRLKGQNKRLFDYLAAGNTIHCFHPAMKELRIGYLNSRCADICRELREQGSDLYKRWKKVEDTDGNEVTVREYSLLPFEH